MPEQKDHLKSKEQTEGQRLSLNQGFVAERNKLLQTAEMRRQGQGRWIRAWALGEGEGQKGLSSTQVVLSVTSRTMLRALGQSCKGW